MHVRTQVRSTLEAPYLAKRGAYDSFIIRLSAYGFFLVSFVSSRLLSYRLVLSCPRKFSNGLENITKNYET